MSIPSILSNIHKHITGYILPILVVCFFTSNPGGAQNTYWGTLGDSLIHSQESLLNLSKKVDSLHRVFEKSAPPQQQLFSAQQGYGCYFQVFDAPFSLDSLKQDLKAGLSKNELAKKYPEIKWMRDSVLIYKYESANPEGILEQVFVEAPNEWEEGYIGEYKIYPELATPTVVFESYTSGDSGGGFFFYQKLVSQPIPPEANKLMQYVDFMIGEWPRNMFQGIDYTVKNEIRRAAGNTIRAFITSMDAIPEEDIDSVVARIYLENPDFRAEVEAVAQATLVIGAETYTTRNVNSIILPLFPLDRQYDLLCRQPLNWSCGNDPAPRYHILKTAQVAAQIGDLPVFVKSHFFLANDCYGRGYYPNWPSYFRELEAIGLDGVAIAIGACFATQGNRPKINIEYFGKAIREIGKPDALETTLLEFVVDPELDDLNRLRMIWLYHIWAGNSPDKQAKMDKLRSLELRLPSYLRKAVR